MRTSLFPREAADTRLSGELRYGVELTRLIASREFLRPPRRTSGPPVLLIPGLMAGDQSLAVMAGWLRRQGVPTASAGIWLNVDCAERAMGALQARLRSLADEAGRPVVLVGQSRGGEQARVLAARNPELVSTLVMLGSPVVDPLHVASVVLNTVRSVARLGDLGIPGLFSSECGDGDCCAEFRRHLGGPMPPAVRAVSVYSRSDGIVSWRACLDPSAEHVEVDSSHGGMSVNLEVYRLLAGILDGEEDRWTG